MFEGNTNFSSHPPPSPNLSTPGLYHLHRTSTVLSIECVPSLTARSNVVTATLLPSTLSTTPTRTTSLDRSSGYGIASPRPIAGLLFPANPDCTNNARHLHRGGTDNALGTHPLPGPSFGPYKYKIAPTAGAVLADPSSQAYHVVPAAAGLALVVTSL